MDREDIRKKIKASATNLCTLVVNTACEYKEELIQLEMDNVKLTRKNKHLVKINNNLTEQNEILLEQLHQSEKRVRKLIERLGGNNLCYNCDHYIECKISSICVYCQERVCLCCIKTCESGKECSIVICLSCIKTHPICPLHNETSHSEELLNYYRENKFKRL